MILHRSEPPSERKRRSDSSSRRDTKRARRFTPSRKDADWDRAVLPPRWEPQRERDRVILRQSNQRRETEWFFVNQINGERREERQLECWIVEEMNRGEVMNRGGSIDGAVERSIVEKSRDPSFRRTRERERRDQTLYCSNTCLLRRASPTL